MRSLALIVDDNGQKLTASALRGHFDRAREARRNWQKIFQFRDLRAKAATGTIELTGDIRETQKQLGHTTIAMTEH